MGYVGFVVRSMVAGDLKEKNVRISHLIHVAEHSCLSVYIGAVLATDIVMIRSEQVQHFGA